MSGIRPPSISNHSSTVWCAGELGSRYHSDDSSCIPTASRTARNSTLSDHMSHERVL